MKQLKALILVQLRSLFGESASKKRRGVSSLIQTGSLLGAGLLLALILASFLFIAGALSLLLCIPLVEAGADVVYFAIMATLAFLVNLFFTARMIQSRLFEAGDNALLLAMPIPPQTILLSRILFLLLSDLLMTAVILVPAGVVYLFVGQASILGILVFAVGILALPFLSLSAASLLGWLLSLISSRLRNKSILPTVLSILFLIVYFAVYMQSEQILAALVSNTDAALLFISRWLFPFFCFGQAVVVSPVWLLLFLFIVAVPASLTFYLLSRSFIRIATSTARTKRVAYREKKARQRSAVAAFRQIEFRRLFSSTVYLLNVGIGILFLIAGGIFLLIKADMLRELGALLGGKDLIGAIVIATVTMMSSTFLMTSCSISMEGKTLWIAQSLPTDGRAPLLGKLTAALIFYLPAVLFVSVAAVIRIPLGVIWSLLVIATPVAVTVFLSYLGLLFNLLFPRLEWTNEAAAVKQGMSVFLTMTVGFATVGIGALTVFLLSYLMPLWIPVAIVTSLLAIASTVLHLTVMGYGAKRYLSL
jgi:ABC-2 type transport system permease protein